MSEPDLKEKYVSLLASCYHLMMQELEEWKRTHINLFPFYNELRYATRHVLDAVSPIQEDAANKDIYDDDTIREYWATLYTRDSLFSSIKSLPPMEDDNWDKAMRHLQRLHYDIPEMQFWIAKGAHEQQKKCFNGLELLLYRRHPEMASLKEQALQEILGNLSNPPPLIRLDIRYLLSQMRATTLFAELADKLYNARHDVHEAEQSSYTRQKRSWRRSILFCVLGIFIGSIEKWPDILPALNSLTTQAK